MISYDRRAVAPVFATLHSGIFVVQNLSPSFKLNQLCIVLATLRLHSQMNSSNKFAIIFFTFRIFGQLKTLPYLLFLGGGGQQLSGFVCVYDLVTLGSIPI